MLVVVGLFFVTCMRMIMGAMRLAASMVMAMIRGITRMGMFMGMVMTMLMRMGVGMLV